MLEWALRVTKTSLSTQIFNLHLLFSRMVFSVAHNLRQKSRSYAKHFGTNGPINSPPCPPLLYGCPHSNFIETWPFIRINAIQNSKNCNFLCYSYFAPNFINWCLLKNPSKIRRLTTMTTLIDKQFVKYGITTHFHVSTFDLDRIWKSQKILETF